MFMLYALPLGLVAGLILGGHPGRLADLRLHWVWLALFALVVQIVLFQELVIAAVGDLLAPIYVASTALILAVILRNIRLGVGLAIVALGTVSNLIAIVANGGYMPVTPQALGVAAPEAPVFVMNNVLTTDPAFPALVDAFALPEWLPFSNVFSVGDVLIVLGIVIVMAVAMRRPAAPQLATGDSYVA